VWEWFFDSWVYYDMLSTCLSVASINSVDNFIANLTILCNSSGFIPRPVAYPSTAPTDSQKTSFRLSDTEFNDTVAMAYRLEHTWISAGDASKKIVSATYVSLSFRILRYSQSQSQGSSTSPSWEVRVLRYPTSTSSRDHYPIVVDLEDPLLMRYSASLNVH